MEVEDVLRKVLCILAHECQNASVVSKKWRYICMKECEPFRKFNNIHDKEVNNQLFSLIRQITNMGVDVIIIKITVHDIPAFMHLFTELLQNPKVSVSIIHFECSI